MENCSERDFSNVSEGSIPIAFDYLPNEWIVYRLIWPLLIIFGLSTNIAFLIVVARVSHMKTATNAYLVNLSLADMVNLLSVGVEEIRTTANLVRHERGYIEEYGVVGSHIVNLLQSCCLAVSSAFVTLVTFERFLAICHPIKHHLVKGTSRTCKLIVIAWVVSLLFSSNLLLMCTDVVEICFSWPQEEKFKMYPQRILECRGLSASIYSYLSTMVGPVLWSLIAIILNGFMYVRIMLTLNRRRRKRENIVLNSSCDNDSQLRQVAIMLIANGTIFFTCCFIMMVYINLYSFVLWKPEAYPLSDVQHIIWQHIFHLIFAFNSSINPIVYSVINKRYRNAFLSVFRSCCRKNGNQHTG